jgi:hypothetical protein
LKPCGDVPPACICSSAFARQADTSFGCPAQQRHGFRGAARAAFMVKQHHRQVVLTKRMAALRGGLEVTPRLDVVAHEPRWPTLREVRIRSGKGKGSGGSTWAWRRPRRQ